MPQSFQTVSNACIACSEMHEKCISGKLITTFTDNAGSCM